MRKFFLCSTVILIVILLSNKSHGQGILFQDISLDEAIELAKKENKLVFMDCFTKSCIPCKEMEAKVFPMKEVGDYFNDKFINIKCDTEIGTGPELSKIYNIAVVPTLLFFDTDKEVLLKMTGAPTDGIQFVKDVERGLKPNMSFELLQSEYDSGNISNERMLDYIFVLFKNGNAKLAFEKQTELLGRLSDEEKLSPEYWDIISSQMVNYHNPENLLFIMQHYNKLKNEISESQVNNTITKIIINAFQSSINEIDLIPEYLPDYLEEINNLDLPDKKRLINFLNLGVHYVNKDYKNTVECLIDMDYNQLDIFIITSINKLIVNINNREPKLFEKFIIKKDDILQSIEDGMVKLLLDSTLKQIEKS